MIILDLSGTFFATVAISLRGAKTEIEIGMLRHMILNSIRATRAKFHREYGEFVIACDARGTYWRKDLFAYYKAGRSESRDASNINWGQIFEHFNEIKQEIREYLPYRVIEVHGAEADDVIATLAKKHHQSQSVLIVSRDKDFTQLHRYPNVKQWDPVMKKWVREKDPELYLKKHIICGDAGDGVPNILEGDTALIHRESGKRRPSMTQKRIDNWLAGPPELTMTGEQYRNWVRNRELIDFDYIPQQVTDAILTNYEEASANDRSKLFDYFITKRLRNLTENITDF